MKDQNQSAIVRLIEKGVKIHNPHSVEIGPEVDIDRISGDGVVIYSGCKIFGRSILILQGSKLGYEGPATLKNCQLGPQVELNGGCFRDAVFLKNVSMGSCANVREGTILEEASRAAHSVGLKQTILLPFVTLGSIINVFDCLMAGGTSRKDHSEVGSSFIHFNYTPNQDKATPSLIGDVPRGVMLNQRPIFLGGQGGLVGPCRLEFGTVTAAGSIIRKDELRPGRLIFSGTGRDGSISFRPGMYHSIQRVVIKNITYLANLIALMHWYDRVRSQFVSDDFPEPLFVGLKEKLYMGIEERIGRLKALGRKMPDSATAYQNYAGDNASSRILKQKNEFFEKRNELAHYFKSRKNIDVEENQKDTILEKIQQGIQASGKDYIAVIKGLEEADREKGTRWLQGIVDHIIDGALQVLPSFKRN